MLILGAAMGCNITPKVKLKRENHEPSGVFFFFYKEPLTCAEGAKSSKSALIVSADQLITILCESQQVECHFKGEANSGSAVSSAVRVRSRISTEQEFISHPDCRTCLEGILLVFFLKKEGKEFVLCSLSLLFLAVGPRLSPSGFGCKTPGKDRR